MPDRNAIQSCLFLLLILVFSSSFPCRLMKKKKKSRLAAASPSTSSANLSKQRSRPTSAVKSGVHPPGLEFQDSRQSLLDGEAGSVPTFTFNCWGESALFQMLMLKCTGSCFTAFFLISCLLCGSNDSLYCVSHVRTSRSPYGGPALSLCISCYVSSPLLVLVELLTPVPTCLPSVHLPLAPFCLTFTDAAACLQLQPAAELAP